MVLNCPLPSLATTAFGFTTPLLWLANSLLSAAVNHDGYALSSGAPAPLDYSSSRRELAVLVPVMLEEILKVPKMSGMAETMAKALLVSWVALRSPFAISFLRSGCLIPSGHACGYDITALNQFISSASLSLTVCNSLSPTIENEACSSLTENSNKSWQSCTDHFLGAIACRVACELARQF